MHKNILLDLGIFLLYKYSIWVYYNNKLPEMSNNENRKEWLSCLTRISMPNGSDTV